MTLPHSFKTNTIERVYSFLENSNAIEHISEIDYSRTKFHQVAQGHFGALVDSQLAAESAKPLTKKIICHWQKMITEEQRPFGHHITDDEIGHIRNASLPRNVRVGDHVAPSYNDVPSLLQYLLEDINEQLINTDKFVDDTAYCAFLGKVFHEFMRIHPFTDGNGRTGRLILNFIATRLGRPIIIIDPKIERDEYYAAHKSVPKMVRFMAKKTTEAIFGITGALLVKDKELSGWTWAYKPLGKIKAEPEKVEWHVLEDLLKTMPEEEKKSSEGKRHVSSPTAKKRKAKDVE